MTLTADTWPLGEQPLRARLDRSIKRQTLRALTLAATTYDFSSNDYLGFSKSNLITEKLGEALIQSRHLGAASLPTKTFGASGSRLLYGNSLAIEQFETRVATFHQAESALLFNSGYDANLGLYASLPAESCQFFYDERVHASVKDGIKLSGAKAQPFHHNDLAHLERRLAGANLAPYVAVESLYSMDGDFAPLAELVGLCARYNANLLVDEAHSVGIYGAKGAGLVQQLGLADKIFATVVTYGKAFGCQGACVLGSKLLKNYLINFAHSFIYSTALPTLNILALNVAYDLMPLAAWRLQLHRNIALFRRAVDRHGLAAAMLPSTSAIQGMLLPAPQVLTAAAALQAGGFDVRAIRSPTVRRGTERLRINLHSFNSEMEMQSLVAFLESFV